MTKSFLIKLLCVLLTGLLLTGCQTIGSLVEGKQGELIYGGAQRDIRYIRQGGAGHVESLFFVILSLIDLPLSFVLDTVFLPITIPWELFGSDSAKVEGEFSER